MNQMNINNISKKRGKNWNNNSSSPKRFRLNRRKSVTFKNKNNIRNINTSNEARMYRKSVKRNLTNTENLPEYMKSRSQALEKIHRIKTHKNNTLRYLKEKDKLFKN